MFATEMWERYGFYTVLAVMTLFLQDRVEGFGWTRARATALWSNYLMFVYLTPLLGGLIADRLIGYRRCIVIGGVFFIAGYFLLSLGTIGIFYAALRSSSSAMASSSPISRRSSATSTPPAVRFAIRPTTCSTWESTSARFAAPISAEVLRQKIGYRAAFFSAGVGMVLGTIIFSIFYRYLSQGERKKPSADMQPVELAVDLPPVPDKTAIDDVPEWKRIAALLVIFGIVIVFWMVFHQNGSTMTYWANDNTDWRASKVTPILIQIFTLNLIDGSDVSGVISNAINPFWIIVLSIPLVRFWRWLDSKGMEPSTPTKIGLGMLLTCCAFLILAAGGLAGGNTGRVSPWWIIGAYCVISLGELMLSPMGLSLVSKVAPVHTRGLMMGGWFVATAMGNKLTMIGEYWDEWSHSTFWFVLAMFALGMALVLFALLKPLKRAMPGV